MDNSKLSKIEAIAFIVIIILNHIVLNLPKALLDTCGSSTPLNLIFVIILLFIFLSLILKFWNPFGNSDILDVSEFLGGKILKSILGFAFLCYFLLLTGIIIRNFSEILKLLYLEKAPIILIILVFLIGGIIANRFGFSTITKSNLIIVPLVMISLLIAFFCIFYRFEIRRIFPIFGNGINQTFFSGISNISAFTGLAFLYFLKPLLKEPKDFNKVTYSSFGISAFYLFLSVTTLLFSFADVLTINELSPVYLLIRGTNFGRFLQRPDALFMLVWILSLLSYISISIWIILHVFNKTYKVQNTKFTIYGICSVLLIIALIPRNIAIIRFIQTTIFRYYTFILGFIISFFVFFFAYLKQRKNAHKFPEGGVKKDE